MELPAGRLVAGRYRLSTPLGAGGMGTVWRARDEVLGREVAVKEVTFPQGLSEEDRAVLVERTRREARAAARLDHPSAVTVYDVVEQDGAPYLVMELVEARTLADVVKQDGPLSPQRTAEIGVALLGALDAAHRQGIVHRDVKPSNVMVRDDGRVVLTDFGIATSTGDASITHTGLLLGSPAYIAPERARGQAPAPPSDLWSLGATLFTAVEGRPPYDGGEPILTVTAVVTGEHEPFVAAGPLVPVLEGLLAKDPAERLDADQARRMLQQVAAARPSSDRTQVLPVPAVEPTAQAARTSALDLGDVREEIAATTTPVVPPRRGRPAWLVPAAAAAVLLAGAGGALALNADDDPGTTGAQSTAAPSAAAASPTAPAPTAAPVAPPAAPTTAPSTVAPPAEPSQEPTAAPTAGAPDGTDGDGTDGDGTDGDGTADEADGASDGDASDGEEAAGLPAGWTTDTGGAGWTVALPPGYAQTGAGEYRQAETGRTLRIETGAGRPDAVADRQNAARSFAQRHPSYREIRIEPADYRGYEAADWEFTYEGLHVVNRVFVVDGTGHSLFFQTRQGDADGARQDFDAIARAFTPVGG